MAYIESISSKWAMMALESVDPSVRGKHLWRLLPPAVLSPSAACFRLLPPAAPYCRLLLPTAACKLFSLGEGLGKCCSLSGMGFFHMYICPNEMALLPEFSLSGSLGLTRSVMTTLVIMHVAHLLIVIGGVALMYNLVLHRFQRNSKWRCPFFYPGHPPMSFCSRLLLPAPAFYRLQANFLDWP